MTARRPPTADAGTDLPCVGRNSELRLVLDALQAAEGGRGACLLLTGPAGIGKSRLLRRVAELASQRGHDVFVEHAVEGVPEPLLTFESMIDRFTGRGPPAAPFAYSAAEERGRGPGAPSRGRGGRLGRPGRSWSRAPASPPDPVLRRVIEGLERASLERPQLVLLDDLQFADVESWRGVRWLIHVCRSRPIVVVLSARVTPEGQDQDGVGRRLLDLRRLPGVRSVELGPLDDDSRTQLVAHMLDGEAPAGSARERLRPLVRWLGGTPYFLVEYVSSLRDRAAHEGHSRLTIDDLVARTPHRDGPPHGIPPGIRVTILDRFHRLLPGDQRLLRLAAFLGPEFDAEPLASAVGRPVAHVLARLGRLCSDGWPVRPIATERARFGFEHSLLWTTIREEPNADIDRPALLRLVRWWADHRPDDPLTEARLRAQLNDSEGAWESLLRGLHRFLRAGALRSIPELVRWGRTEISDGRPTAVYLSRIVREAGAELRRRWEFDRLQELLDELPAAGLPADVAWLAALWSLDCRAARGESVRLSDLEDLASSARSAFAEGDPEPERMLGYIRGIAAWSASPPVLAHRSVDRALRNLDDGRHETERMRLITLDAMLYSNEGRPKPARLRLRMLRSIASERPHPSLGRLVRHLDMHIAFREGRLSYAMAQCRRQIASNRQFGDSSREARDYLQLAAYEFAVRHPSQAHRALEDAELLFTRLQLARGIAAVNLLRGWTFGLERRWPEARAEFLKARGPRKPGEEYSHPAWVAAIGLAWVLAETGNVGAAAAELPALEPEVSRSSAYRTECLWASARVRELAGDRHEARSLLERAARASRSVGGTATDRIEAMLQLSRWESSYGDPRIARRWERRVTHSGLASARVAARWVGIGFGPHLSGRTTRPARPGPPSVGLRVSVQPLGDTILDYLSLHRYGPAAQPGHPTNTGWTEQELAASLGVDRARFSRALGRLRGAGLVDREAVRRPGTSRSVYAYQLSPRAAASPRTVRP